MANLVDEAAAALQSSRLYVDATAEAELEAARRPFDEGNRSAARDALDDASPPIYVAVLPSAAEGVVDVAAIAQAVGADGSYVVVTPDGNTDAVSNQLSGARDAVRAASVESRDVSEFIDKLIVRFDALPAAGSNGSESAPDSSNGGGGLLPLAIIAAAGGGGFLLYRRNKRNKESAQLELARGALDEDITAYGEQLSALDLDLKVNSAVPVEAQQEYRQALDLYEQAKTYADRAERPADLQPVTQSLEEGRWLLSCVAARLNNEPLPERRLPCFFDPRHGPSAEDVEWAPPGGVPRTVPACAADAVRIQDGDDPSIRLVNAGDGQQRPYWDAGPAYGGWAGGYFAGGLLPGMLMGTMLGSAMSGPAYIGDSSGYSGSDHDESGGDWGGGFDGGGGGDWGGGFDGGGGGDWGGGFGD